MKRFEAVLKTTFVFILCAVFQHSAQAEKYDPVAYMDSVEFSLITCSPHEEIYSLYGHTALRVHDLHQGKQQDVVFNWGVFNFDTPFFVTRFVFGLTDYELGMGDFSLFCRYYQQWGSSVNEQVLNLTSEEKVKLNGLLEENYRPENRVYRYNYFYDNCSTRPRDMIERCVNGKLVYMVYNTTDYIEPTFREMIHWKTSRHPWATFGNDMLLGLKADMKASRKEQEFLPENLMNDFNHAQINTLDGSSRPLVKERRMPVMPGVQVIEQDFFVSPTECAILLLFVSLIFAMLEWKRKKSFKYWDATLMLLVGLAGCVLFVMLFSQHPTTSTNLQLLLINPVHLFYIPAVLRRKKTRYWMVLLTMVCLFFIGACFQHYAEGLFILALCLLLRFWLHHRVVV